MQGHMQADRVMVAAKKMAVMAEASVPASTVPLAAGSLSMVKPREREELMVLPVEVAVE